MPAETPAALPVLPTLKIVVASTRPGRVGRTVADWFHGIANAHGGFDVQLLDLLEVGLPFHDEPAHPATGIYEHDHTKRWSAEIDSADAFVFVMPEYNYGFNAPLKNALDFVYREWHYKPVGLVSYGGVAGGLRAAQMIKQVVTTLKMMPLTEGVNIHFVRNYLGDDGEFRGDETHERSAASMLAELVRTAEALRPLRRPRP
jgi:NAD(P)H-dependent FMN reductase